MGVEQRVNNLTVDCLFCCVTSQSTAMVMSGQTNICQSTNFGVSSFKTGNPKMGTLAHTEDPGGMQRNTVFHKGIDTRF